MSPPIIKSPKNKAGNLWWTLKLIYASAPPVIITLLIVQIISSITPFARNKIFAQLIDDVLKQIPSSFPQSSFSLFLTFLALSSIFMFLQNQLNRIMDQRLQSYLRKLFINKVCHLDYQHLESKDTGNLISKVDEEFGWRIRQTASDLTNIFSNLISLTTVTIILLPIYPKLWLLIFLSQIPQYLLEKHWVKKNWQLHELNSEKNKQIWDLNHQLRQKNFIAELRVNNAIDHLFKKYAYLFDEITNNRISLRIKQMPTEFILTIFSTIITGITLSVLINDIRHGLLSIGLFTFYFQSITQISDFFRGLVFSFVSINENSYHINNFRKIINLKNFIVGGHAKISQPIPPLIEFKNVSFKYPESDNFVFKNLNLVINSKEEIAIVGINGAGKSTLIKLICNFYQPTSGEILINGVNLDKIDLKNWYHQLSYLAQEFNNYWNLNLRENIEIGNPKIKNISKIISSLQKSDAMFYKKYKKGLETPLSPRYGGEEPSWGQWQKIAIARTFYRNAPIIILDEPTASIDAVSEFKIFKKLYQQITGKTLIIVSHRFSTVRNAQRIIVIDKGKIVESGSHQQLIKLNGLYAKSFKLQAKGYTQVD